jgi:hypothetical protein
VPWPPCHRTCSKNGNFSLEVNGHARGKLLVAPPVQLPPVPITIPVTATSVCRPLIMLVPSGSSTEDGDMDDGEPTYVCYPVVNSSSGAPSASLPASPSFCMSLPEPREIPHVAASRLVAVCCCLAAGLAPVSCRKLSSCRLTLLFLDALISKPLMAGYCSVPHCSLGSDSATGGLSGWAISPRLLLHRLRDGV